MLQLFQIGWGCERMTAVLEAAKVSSHEVEQIQGLVAGLDNDHLAAVLQYLVNALERGADVTLLEADKELTPNEVANILQVSRPHVVKLMDRGLLVYRMVGAHRRVAMSDLLDYIQRHEKANAYVSGLIASRDESLAAVKDAAAELTDEDLAELSAIGE